MLRLSHFISGSFLCAVGTMVSLHCTEMQLSANEYSRAHVPHPCPTPVQEACPPLMIELFSDPCPTPDESYSSGPLQQGTGEIAPGEVSSPSDSPLESAPSYSDASPSDFDLSRGLATSFGAGGAASLAFADVPNMLGDFFGGTFMQNYYDSGGTVAVAGGDRRFKISENTSPIPIDRVFVTYNHFHRALVDVNGARQNLDRFTLGFEKTFLSGQASFEMRLPIAAGLDSTQVAGLSNTQGTELGNLAMALKFVLLSSQNSLLSAGLTTTVPTGDDYVEEQQIFNVFRVENQAVHLAPFLGFASSLNRDWFFQSFLQADIDLNGNDVYSNSVFQGTLQDQNLLFVDVSLGRWLHQRRDYRGNPFGVALIGEMHYTTTLNDSDWVSDFTNPYGSMDILNATAGLHFQAGKSNLRVGIGAPMRDDEESLFDTEVLVQFNRVF